MHYIQSLIAELKQEAANTTKILALVPLNKADWKPHTKSMSLGALAVHIAEIPGWTTMILHTDGVDFANMDFTPRVAATTEELLDIHDENVTKAIEALQLSKDEDYENTWTMRTGETIHFILPKSEVIRTYSYSHLVHHRAQLGVYLRLLDIPLPGFYGPTADEMEAFGK
jgi:uncharacterized damage-inducible protein DinB